MTAFEPREVCLRCRRPTSVCYCEALPRLETVTRVVILQHPRERHMPIGTARMASLCLPQATLHVGMRWDDSSVLRQALADPERPPILLYPGPGARDILTDPPTGPVTLIVVDGTWPQAKCVVRDNPVLRGLTRYAFNAPEPSQYRIRREPRAEYCSTIEALMHVLGALEGDPARFRALLDPFRAMVDAHLARKELAPNLRPYHQRARAPKLPSARLPRELRKRFGDLLCVVGEANAWPYQATEHGLGDELVHWVARRPATGETFDMIAAPVKPLSPSTEFHSELSEARMRAGVTSDALLAGFADFVRHDDVICAWGSYAPRLFETAGGVLPAARIDLRAIAQRLTAGKPGALEDYAHRVSALATPELPDGRAGRRLGMLAGIITAWRDLPVASEIPGPAPARRLQSE